MRAVSHLQQGDDTIFQDAAATFRSLKLNDSYQAEGEGGNDDSSSSSSSNEEADVSLRMPPSVVMQVCCLHFGHQASQVCLLPQCAWARAFSAMYLRLLLYAN